MYWNGPGVEIPNLPSWDSLNSMEGQDKWVLTVLGGKQHGTYVEIGSGHPVMGNNTFVLENHFGWTGVGVEHDHEMVKEYNSTRVNPCMHFDAMAFDYASYFRNNHFPSQIDYLQIDIDDKPFAANLLALIALPLTEYRFSTITIEHGLVTNYKMGPLRDAQRLILSSIGYRLIVQGVNEDWWIDETAVPYEKYGYMFQIG
jgi:hypothetical protein